MNGDNFKNPDCHRDTEDRTVNKPGLILNVLTVLFCSVFIASCNTGYSSSDNFEIFSVAAGAAGVINLAVSAFTPWLCILLAGSGVLSFTVFGTTVPWSIAVSAVAIIASFSALICIVPPKYKLAVWLIPPAAYLFALPATLLDPLIAFNAISLYPAATILGFFQSRRRERVSSICACSALLLISFAALTAFSLYRELGSLELSTVTEYIFSVRDNFADNIFAQLTETYEQAGVELDLVLEDIVYILDQIISVLPAILVIFCNALAFFSQRMTFKKLAKEQAAEFLAPEAVTFRMSLASAILFALSFLLYILPSSSSDSVWRVVSTASENLFLILTPGLFVFGLIQIRRIASKHRLLFIPIAGILLLGLFSLFVILALACFGAAYTVFSSINARKGGKGDDNSQ